MNKKLPCIECGGVCCKQEFRQYAVWIQEEEKHLFPESILFQESPNEFIYVLPNTDGHCIHLKNDRCSIYENRPILCKQFDCTECGGFFFDDNPQVYQILLKNNIKVGYYDAT